MINPLKKKRLALGKTQQQIADKLGVDVRNISKYELNKTCPNFADLLSVIRAYELTNEELYEYMAYAEELKNNKKITKE